MKYINSEIIKSYVDGAECQYYDMLTNHWEDIDDLNDFELFKNVRIKPRRNVVKYLYVSTEDVHFDISLPEGGYANLKVTFDGETGEPKSVELIK
jgi:hypothetical protein